MSFAAFALTPKDWHWKQPASATRPATAPAPAPDDGAWWTVFADPQLEALESKVLERRNAARLRQSAPAIGRWRQHGRARPERLLR